MRRSRFGDLAHQRVELRRGVGDARQNRHDVDADVDARLAQARDAAEPGDRSGRARLEAPRKLAVDGNQRHVDVNRRVAEDSLHDVDVARDERTLGDEADAEPRVLGEDLENRPGDFEAALGGLIRISRRADRDRLALDQGGVPIGALSERLPEHVSRV